MRRGGLLLVAALALLFTALIGLLRTAPAGESAVARFVQPPPDCPLPCWAGIRPGQTHADDAMRLLAANGWIGVIDTRYHLGFFNGWITWHWSGSQPPLTVRDGYDNLWVDFGTVRSITIATRARLGDVWLALGQPLWTRTQANRGLIFADFAYLDATLIVKVSVNCPATLADVWAAPVQLQWQEAETHPAVTDTRWRRPRQLCA